MSTSILDNKLLVPDDKQLNAVLGESKKIFDAIYAYIEEKYEPVKKEWKFYNQKSGWILKSLRKKRNLFFIIPHDNYFNIGFVFGDKAVGVIEKSKLPNDIISNIVNARKYAEGRGLSFEVRNKNDIENIKMLIDIKIEN